VTLVLRSKEFSGLAVSITLRMTYNVPAGFVGTPQVSLSQLQRGHPPSPLLARLVLRREGALNRGPRPHPAARRVTCEQHQAWLHCTSTLTPFPTPQTGRRLLQENDASVTVDSSSSICTERVELLESNYQQDDLIFPTALDLDACGMRR
jgi:hypothetical protein